MLYDDILYDALRAQGFRVNETRKGVFLAEPKSLEELAVMGETLCKEDPNFSKQLDTFVADPGNDDEPMLYLCYNLNDEDEDADELYFSIEPATGRISVADC